MGILDDAIREHLDLKRKHGARDSEISEIEDEALGSGDRPDPFAAGELFGQVSSAGASAPEAPAKESGPATPPSDSLEEAPAGEEPTALVESLPEAPSEPPKAEPAEPSFPEPPTPESPSAPEPRTSEPPAPESPSAPESESLEELMAEDEPEEEASPLPGGADTAVPPPPPPEGEAARPEPPTPSPPAATEGQRGRALGRADVPTQEHIPPREGTEDSLALPGEPDLPPSEPESPVDEAEPPASEPPPLSIEAEARDQDSPQLYDFETDPGLLEDPNADLEPAPPPAEESDDFEALGPVDEGEETGDDLYPDEPYEERRGDTTDFEDAEPAEGGFETEVRPAAPVDDEDDGYGTEVRPALPAEDDEEEDDILSESPEFLDEDTDEGLWFEKGPPKDFDFEDEDKK